MARSQTAIDKWIAAAFAWYSAIAAGLDNWFDVSEAWTDEVLPDNPFRAGTRRHRVAAQVRTVIQGVAIVIVSSIGVVVVDTFDTSFDAPTNTGLSESQEGLLSGFGSMIDLVEPLLVVLMAVVLIAVIQRVGAND